jgi:hypothetical protein
VNDTELNPDVAFLESALAKLNLNGVAEIKIDRQRGFGVATSGVDGNSYRLYCDGEVPQRCLYVTLVKCYSERTEYLRARRQFEQEVTSFWADGNCLPESRFAVEY